MRNIHRQQQQKKKSWINITVEDLEEKINRKKKSFYIYMLVMTNCIQKIVTTNDLRVIRDSRLAIGLQSGLTKLTYPQTPFHSIY